MAAGLPPVKNSLTGSSGLQYLGAVPGGRPRRTSAPDSAADAIARRAIEDLAGAEARRRQTTTRNRLASTPSGHLLRAVLAARVAAAAERLARAEVAKARETDGLTWEQVGEAFGTTKQSAHERFRA